VSAIKVDIVSDVVCPWCIVGLRQLQDAAKNAEMDIDVHWHPFELNPNMPGSGQDLQEHMCEKYGTSVEQSNEARQNLTNIGDNLNIAFKFDQESRIVNTFKAHQLLHWANLQGSEHALKMGLFTAYFTDQLDINDSAVLLGVVESIGLDKNEAKAVLDDSRFETAVREEQRLWIDRGVSGVPAMVFSEKYLVTGAQGVENYTKILGTIASELGKSEVTAT